MVWQPFCVGKMNQIANREFGSRQYRTVDQFYPGSWLFSWRICCCRECDAENLIIRNIFQFELGSDDCAELQLVGHNAPIDGAHLHLKSRRPCVDSAGNRNE